MNYTGFATFSVRPWDEIEDFYRGIAPLSVNLQAVLDVVESVVASQRTDLLAAHTSMHDLYVRPTPLHEGGSDFVAVRASGTFAHLGSVVGSIAIEHVSRTGNDDRLVRPVADAVPLFWRFMIEKWGIHPIG
jgi:hypothetical protein